MILSHYLLICCIFGELGVFGLHTVSSFYQKNGNPKKNYCERGCPILRDIHSIKGLRAHSDRKSDDHIMLFNLGGGSNTFTHWPTKTGEHMVYYRRGMDALMMAPAKGERLGREGKHMAVDTSHDGVQPLLSLLLKAQFVEGCEVDTFKYFFDFIVTETNKYYDEHKDSLTAAKDFTPLPKASPHTSSSTPPPPSPRSLILFLPRPFVFYFPAFTTLSRHFLFYFFAR